MNKNTLTLTLAMIAAFSPQAMAQGTNDGLGGDDANIQSLYEIISKQEKKSKAFNFFINYGASFKAYHDSREGGWTAGFYNRNLKVEMTGWLTDHLYYRFRHSLTKTSEAKSWDNFAKATDYMMVGWKINDHWSIETGKKCQALGAFEFDENPLFVYQFSDIEDNVDSSKGAINLLYSPTPSQQLTFEVSNTYNGKFEDEFGEQAKLTNGLPAPDGTTPSATERLQKANVPLAYSAGWNGKFLDNKLQTRWSYTLRTQAKHKYSRFLRLGQQLNLSRLQWYVDYNMTYDDLDRMRIISSEAIPLLSPSSVDLYAGKVRYQGWVTKMNWQFASDWNLVVKGMYETASMSRSEQFHHYRKAFGYVGSIEYFPARKQQQDLRLFLAYTGRKYDYSKRSQLAGYNTNRIELGMFYRMKLL